MNTFPTFSDFKETATNEAMVQVAKSLEKINHQVHMYLRL